MKSKILANKRVPFSFFIILVFSNIALLAAIGWLIRENKDKFLPVYQTETTNSPAPIETQALSTGTTTPTTEQGVTQIVTPEATATINVQIVEKASAEGFMVLALRDGLYTNLYLYHPQYLSMTRLWNGNWDDITPAISPDGNKIAFSSRRNGYWDLYVYDFTNNETLRLTDSTAYDGSPTWSPDGEWIAYECYADNNFDIYIQSVVDLNQPAIRLTDDTAADFSPSWSGNGRQIAFVSTRSGEEEIWVVNLDDDKNRFNNVSQNPSGHDTAPAWSPDGSSLAWSTDQNGTQTIIVKPISEGRNAYTLGSGTQPIWDPTGNNIAVVLKNPNQILLGAYAINSGEITQPFQKLPGNLAGLDWKEGDLLSFLTNVDSSSTNPTEPLWTGVVDINPSPPNNRFGIVLIPNVNVANPYLHDSVDESFSALREQIASIAGWDFLGNLESAFLPITSPSAPEMIDNWLYTGRAFTINTLPMSADWLVITREDFSGQTYWRVYIKARYQDGSQGLPLKSMIWDLEARYAGEPRTYEEGGKYETIPDGYWVDFTAWALDYGWLRFPALIDWRTYYQGTRFNLFVFNDNLDWDSAMSQIYPPEAMMTITYIPTPTRETLFTVTPTPTPHPTFTPAP